MLVRVILVLILTKRELYFRRVCVYISKKTRVQRNLSSLAARAEGLFSLLFLIVADEQPLLPVVVLPAYIFQRATCCCSCSGCVTAPYDVNLFLVPSVCFYHVYSSLLFPFVFNSEAGFAELSLYIKGNHFPYMEEKKQCILLMTTYRQDRIHRGYPFFRAVCFPKYTQAFKVFMLRSVSL